jgi:hypothetical protein
MTEELETTKEIAKAVQETGKAVQGVTELVGNVGSWMSWVMGTVPEDVVALVAADRLRALRLQKQLEHLDSIRRKQEEILNKRGVEEPEAIGLKQAIPAFEAMADESDETLQELWARLLANAMDPNRDVNLQQIFIDTLKKFEPLDALTLEKLNTLATSKKEAATIREEIPGNVRASRIQLSLDRLVKFECAIINRGRYQLMALGEELWNATRNDG